MFFLLLLLGQKEEPAKQEDTQAAQEVEAPKEEPAETQAAEEAEAPEKEQVEALAAEVSEEEQEETQAAQKDETPKEEQVSPEPVVSEEKPEAIVQKKPDNIDSAVSVQVGVEYQCNGNRSYTLHKPGVNSESNLCELDAGHTEAPADWYALHDSSFCRQKLQEMVTQHNCVAKE